MPLQDRTWEKAEEELGKSDSALTRWGWFVVAGFHLGTECGLALEQSNVGWWPTQNQSWIGWPSVPTDPVWISTVCLMEEKYISALKCDPPGYSLCKYMLLSNESCKSSFLPCVSACPLAELCKVKSTVKNELIQLRTQEGRGPGDSPGLVGMEKAGLLPWMRLALPKRAVRGQHPAALPVARMPAGPRYEALFPGQRKAATL